MLRARVKISLPARSGQEAAPGCEGLDPAGSHRNEPRQRRCRRADRASRWCPGSRFPGVESSFFDPIIEQVGLGPVERNHLSHTIAEVRQTDRFDRAADPADARFVAGNHQQPPRDERLDPANRGIDGRPCRGRDAQAQRQIALSSRRSSSTSRASPEKAKAIWSTIARTIRQTLASVRDVSASINPIVATRPPQGREAARRAGNVSRPRRSRALPGRPDCRPGFDHACRTAGQKLSDR